MEIDITDIFKTKQDDMKKEMVKIIDSGKCTCLSYDEQQRIKKILTSKD